MKPMLADSADIKEIDKYVKDDLWHFEQKFDGQRMLIVVTDGMPKVLNRQGMPKVTNLSGALLDQFAEFSTGEWIFDGEMLDGCLQMFDLLGAGGMMVPTTIKILLDDDSTEVDDTPIPYHHSLPFARRRETLEALFTMWSPDPKVIQLVHCAKTTDEKATLLRVSQEDQCEGVMLKNIMAPYQPGKRSARMLKCKFTHDVDAIITAVGHEGKDNAVLSLLDPENNRVVEIGRASTIGKKPTPEVGDVWMVTYLYFTDADKRLYQPRLVTKRDDKDYSECLVDQLVTTSKKVVDKTRLTADDDYDLDE